MIAPLLSAEIAEPRYFVHLLDPTLAKLGPLLPFALIWHLGVARGIVDALICQNMQQGGEYFDSAAGLGCFHELVLDKLPHRFVPSLGKKLTAEQVAHIGKRFQGRGVDNDWSRQMPRPILHWRLSRLRPTISRALVPR